MRLEARKYLSDIHGAAGAGVALAGAVGVYLNVVRQGETPVYLEIGGLGRGELP